MRNSIAIRDGIGRGNEGERRHQNFIVVSHTCELQRNMQCCRAIDDGDRVFRARVRGQIGFEAIYEWAGGGDQR